MYIETSPNLWDKAIDMVNNSLDICLYEVYKYFAEDFECVFTEYVSFGVVSFPGFDIRNILALRRSLEVLHLLFFLFSFFLDRVEKHWLKFSFRSLIEFCCNLSGPEIFLGKSLFLLPSQSPHLLLVFFKLLIDSYFNFCSLDEF